MRYGEKHSKYVLKLQVYVFVYILSNSVVKMVVMGLVLGQSLMVISALLLCKSISPLLCTVRFVVVYIESKADRVTTWLWL